MLRVLKSFRALIKPKRERETERKRKQGSFRESIIHKICREIFDCKHLMENKWRKLPKACNESLLSNTLDPSLLKSEIDLL